MTTVKQIFKIPTTNQSMSAPTRQSVEATEDYAIKKVVHTSEGTIEKVPVDDSDITNKKYVDENIASNNLWEIDGGETQLKTADEIDMQSKKIINLTTPTANNDAANKTYVDSNDLWEYVAVGESHVKLKAAKPLNMQSQLITNVLNPTDAQEAATKNYVDTNIITSHTGLTNIGSNTHAQIDTHIASAVSAGSVLTDNGIVRGDGGGRNVQTSGLLIDDNNILQLANSTTTVDGGISFDRTNEDFCVGDGTNSQSVHMGAWKTYTPTWTNLTVGNGTVSARYHKVGKLVTVQIVVIFGSTTSIGTPVNVTSPTTMVNLAGGLGFGVPVGFLACEDNNAGVWYGGATIYRNTTTVRPWVYTAGGTYVAIAELSSSVPMTWAVNDKLEMQWTYEEA